MKEEQLEKIEEKATKEERAKLLWNQIVENLIFVENEWKELSCLLLDPTVKENMPQEVQKLFGRQSTRGKDVYWLFETMINQYERNLDRLKVPQFVKVPEVIKQLNSIGR